MSTLQACPIATISKDPCNKVDVLAVMNPILSYQTGMSRCESIRLDPI